MPRRRRSPSPTSTDSDTDESRHHPQRNAANARERARMRVLSQAFCRLKTTLPWVPADTKLSKLDTLRLATSYIAHLRAALTDQPLPEQPTHKHPLTLTWPFSFQRAEAPPSLAEPANGAAQGAQHQHHPPWEQDPQPPHVVRDREVSYYY